MSNEEKILEMLGQMQSDMAGMKADMAGMKERINLIDERSQRTAVLMEADIVPKLQLLYEGHESIMEYLDKLATKDRVEKLEDEIIILKTAFKAMNHRISELEKAQ